jgi:[ribosomal protein S18]-alanine N-acetyltransferase
MSRPKGRIPVLDTRKHSAPHLLQNKEYQMPGDFIVRILRPTNLNRILQIERACFRQDAYDRKLFAEYARKCGDYFLVARRHAKLADGVAAAGEICGYILTCPCRGGAELVSIAVDPAARGQGAASALMESTLRRLRDAGITRLMLTVRVTNLRALRFYKRYGFRKTSLVRGYYEDGGDGWRMVKLLRPNRTS